MNPTTVSPKDKEGIGVIQRIQDAICVVIRVKKSHRSRINIIARRIDINSIKGSLFPINTSIG